MAKRNLLLVDADSRSLRVLEVSLRKAGYSVTSCGTAEEALEFVELARPDLILSDTVLGTLDGFAFVERLRERSELTEVPLMFLSSDGSVESKVRGLELGVEDYLTKPIYIKEIITRVNLVLQRFERQGLERRSLTKTRFSGSLSEMGLVDLLQTIDISRKSGVLHLSQGDKRGAVFFDEGALAHAELGPLRGEHAVYRFLVWNDGHFDLEFRPVRIAERTIQMSTQGLLMEGMRRVDEWGRMLEQLPPLDRIFEVDDAALVERLAEIPDELNDLLRLFDGQRSLMQVVDDRSADDLGTLESISKLYFEGLIVDSGRARADEDEALEEALLPASGRANADASSVSRASTVPSRASYEDDKTNDSEGSSSLFPEGTEDAAPGARSGPSTDAAVPALDVDEASEPRTDSSAASSKTDSVAPGHSTVSEVPPSEAPSATESKAESAASAATAATTSENEAAEDDSEEDSSESADDPTTAASEANMAKKGNRRRKRSKTRESIPESNVIQFPAQKAAAAEAAVATVSVREDESGQHRVEAEREAERSKRLAEAAKKREQAAAKRADAEGKRSDAEVKRAEAEALRADAEAKQADAEAKRFDVKRAEAEVKKAEAELKKAEAQKDEDAAAKAREVAKAKKAEAEEHAATADALERESTTLSDGVGGLERTAISLQNEAKDLVSEAEALEAEAAAIETAPPTVGVAVDAEAEARASEAPKAKASEPPKKASEPPKAKASEPPKKAEAEARKSDPPKSKGSESPKGKKSEAPKSKVKEVRTSSSQTIKAITTSGEHAAVAEEFFTAKAYEAEIEHETWDDLELDRVPQSISDRKWRRVTLGFVAAGALVIGGYWLYHNVLMPTPVELATGTGAPQMPDMGNLGTTMEAEEEAPAEPTEAAEVAEVAPTEAPAEEVAAEEAAPTEEVAAEAPAEEAAPTEEVAVEAPAAAPGAYEALMEEAGRLRGARQIAKLEEALAANPNGAEALEELGWIQLNRGQNARAAELAQRASVLLPTSSKVWITLGAARQALRDAEGAQAAYRSCVEQGQGQYVAECRRMAR